MSIEWTETSPLLTHGNGAEEYSGLRHGVYAQIRGQVVVGPYKTTLLMHHVDEGQSWVDSEEFATLWEAKAWAERIIDNLIAADELVTDWIDPSQTVQIEQNTMANDNETAGQAEQHPHEYQERLEELRQQHTTLVFDDIYAALTEHEYTCLCTLCQLLDVIAAMRIDRIIKRPYQHEA